MLGGLISRTGPGTNPGGDAKLCQANSGMHAIGVLGSQLSPSSINLVPA